MKRFPGIPRHVSLGILIVVLVWGIPSLAPATEVDSVIVAAIDPESGHLLLAKLGVAKYMIPLKVASDTLVVTSSGKPLAFSDIRVGSQGTIRYTRSPSGEYAIVTLVLD